MKRRWLWQGMAVAALFAWAVLLVLTIRHLNGPRIIAKADAPDGTEMCIVQRCNWSGEPAAGHGWYPVEHLADLCDVFVYCDWRAGLPDPDALRHGLEIRWIDEPVLYGRE